MTTGAPSSRPPASVLQSSSPVVARNARRRPSKPPANTRPSETAGVGWRDDPAYPYTLLPGWRRDDDGLLKGQRPVQLPDLLGWEDDERFRLLGRRDSAVQVGGFNVVPEEVCAALLRHPAVADAAVRPMRPEEGDRLKAFVVPAAAADPDELSAALRRFAVATLTPAQRPGAYSFGPALPRTELGKLADWAADPDPRGREQAA